MSRPSTTANATRLSLALLAGLLASPAFADASAAALQAFRDRQQQLSRLGQVSAPKALSASIFRSGFEHVAVDCGADSDGDGLSDCVETGTGVFVGTQDTGTDPHHADTDGDGLGDGEEVLGSATGLDLRALGASPLRRDILIEYDWFDSDYECGPHSQRPSAEAMRRVAAMFAAAPLANPDGSTGIHLIQDYGQGGAFTGGNRVEGHDAILPGAFDATYHTIKNANFAPARLGYFRYVLMPHRYGGGINSGGAAEVVGDDAIVSLYCHNSDDNVARTIAHELGHLLGLYHGGFEDCNDKPNYNSLMNYRYQYSGVDTVCAARGDQHTDDFSRGDRLALDENDLDEAQGVCGNRAIDWNQNGNVEAGIALDLNPDAGATCGEGLRRLEDFDDWRNLSFLGIADHTGKLEDIQQHTTCAGAAPPR
jgi:hypothetical protein